MCMENVDCYVQLRALSYVIFTTGAGVLVIHILRMRKLKAESCYVKVTRGGSGKDSARSDLRFFF